MWSTKDERIQISSIWSCSGKDPGFSRGNLYDSFSLKVLKLQCDEGVPDCDFAKTIIALGWQAVPITYNLTMLLAQDRFLYASMTAASAT